MWLRSVDGVTRRSVLHPVSECAQFDACVRRGYLWQFVAAVSQFEWSRMFLDLLAGACVDFAAAGLCGGPCSGLDFAVDFAAASCALCDDMCTGALTGG